MKKVFFVLVAGALSAGCGTVRLASDASACSDAAEVVARGSSGRGGGGVSWLYRNTLGVRPGPTRGSTITYYRLDQASVSYSELKSVRIRYNPLTVLFGTVLSLGLYNPAAYYSIQFVETNNSVKAMPVSPFVGVNTKGKRGADDGYGHVYDANCWNFFPLYLVRPWYAVTGNRFPRAVLCQKREEDYERAVRAGTETALNDFVARYPGSKRASDAKWMMSRVQAAAQQRAITAAGRDTVTNPVARGDISDANRSRARELVRQMNGLSDQLLAKLEAPYDTWVERLVAAATNAALPSFSLDVDAGRLRYTLCEGVWHELNMKDVSTSFLVKSRVHVMTTPNEYVALHIGDSLYWRNSMIIFFSSSGGAASQFEGAVRELQKIYRSSSP